MFFIIFLEIIFFQSKHAESSFGEFNCVGPKSLTISEFGVIVEVSRVGKLSLTERQYMRSTNVDIRPCKQGHSTI